jgi:hypothetical protein
LKWEGGRLDGEVEEEEEEVGRCDGKEWEGGRAVEGRGREERWERSARVPGEVGGGRRESRAARPRRRAIGSSTVGDGRWLEFEFADEEVADGGRKEANGVGREEEDELREDEVPARRADAEEEEEEVEDERRVEAREKNRPSMRRVDSEERREAVWVTWRRVSICTHKIRQRVVSLPHQQPNKASARKDGIPGTLYPLDPPDASLFRAGLSRGLLALNE